MLEYDNNNKKQTQVKSTFNSKTSGYRNGLFAALDELKKKQCCHCRRRRSCCCFSSFFNRNNSRAREYDDTGMRMHIALWDLITCSITLNRLVTPEIDQSVDHRIKKKHDEEWNEMSFARATSIQYSLQHAL